VEKYSIAGQITDDWRMRIACWIPKATNTDSEYLILIAFTLKQRLHERASMLRYTYIACLSCLFPCSVLRGSNMERIKVA
jgi:hypothetical protein